MATTPVVVAQRMADLLQCFPSAAIGGVQWHTLVRKYEEKHGALPSLEQLGHSSALAAATALLFDVVRIVDTSDTDNPVVAVDDAIALTPVPGGLASWPSMYKVLCDIACNHGEVEGPDSSMILLSKVKPLLQRHWHSNFDELGLAYFTEEGSTIKLKKMKHLLQALLRWRTQHVEWSASMMAHGCCARAACSTELAAALDMELLLVPSKTHNDLILRCVHSTPLSVPPAAMPTMLAGDDIREKAVLRLEIPERQKRWADVSVTEEDTTEGVSSSCSSCKSADGVSCGSATHRRNLEEELAFLRSENVKLRCENYVLESQATFTPTYLFPEQSKVFEEVFEDFDLDDPSEPPPYRYVSPARSTSSVSFGSGFCSGSITPFSESSASLAASGCATPMMVPTGVPMPMMPVWFQIIPSGVVQEARAMFAGSAVPSWFVDQQ